MRCRWHREAPKRARSWVGRILAGKASCGRCVEKAQHCGDFQQDVELDTRSCGNGSQANVNGIPFVRATYLSWLYCHNFKMVSQNPLADRSNPPTTSDTTPVTMLSHGRLNGKVAIVTGGAAGFGAGITNPCLIRRRSPRADRDDQR